MTSYFLRTLGHLSLHEGDVHGDVVLSDAKALAVLAYLADRPEGEADRAHLARLLWPGMEMSRARAGLRQALYYLRRKTGDGTVLVRTGDDRLTLVGRHLDTDLWMFREALRQRDWESAVDLHDGAFLGGYGVDGASEFRHWRDSLDDGLRAGVRESCRTLISEGLEGGDPDRALRGARRWAEMNPLDEEAQAGLVRSLVAAGDRAGAFEAYESYRSLLREELGESPGPRLQEALDELRSMALDGGDSRPPPGDEGAEGSPLPPSTDERSASGRKRGVAGSIAGALALLVVAAAGWRMLAGAASEEGAPIPRSEVVVADELAGDQSVHRVIRWFGDSANVERAGAWPAGAVAGPSGERAAVGIEGPEGIDLALRTAGRTERRVLAATAADESPVAWSPDGRRILYRAGRMEGDGTYRRRYRIVRLEAGRVDSLRLFILANTSVDREADWSPLGTSVAVVSDSAGNLDVWTVRPDGTEARNLTGDHGGRDVDPAFSPDGSDIAFVSDRSGNRDVWVVPARGGEPRRLTRSRAPEATPVWLDPRTVGFVRERPEGAELWSVDLVDGVSRPVTPAPWFRRLVGVRRPGTGPSWIESVRVPDEFARVSPGQWIRKSVVLEDARGNGLPSDGIPLRWSVTDGSVVDLDAGDGWIRVRSEGEAILRVSAAGWRGDTVRVRSLLPEVRELEPVLSEDWSGGIDSTVWQAMGDPLPTVVGAEGRFPRAFLSRGDENYSSGVVSRRPLRAREGLTVEVWGRIPYTSPYHQAYQVALLGERLPGGAVPGLEGGKELSVRIHSLIPDSIEVYTTHGVGTVRAPAPEALGEWHRYTFQVDTTGGLSVLVDGRMHWRWPDALELDRLGDVRLALHGRSEGTRILHGPVRVWEGARYRLP